MTSDTEAIWYNLSINIRNILIYVIYGVLKFKCDFDQILNDKIKMSIQFLNNNQKFIFTYRKIKASVLFRQIKNVLNDWNDPAYSISGRNKGQDTFAASASGRDRHRRDDHLQGAITKRGSQGSPTFYEPLRDHSNNTECVKDLN